jgi:histidinol-phosphate aminotransferase
VLNRLKPPYNINGATQALAMEGLKNLLLKEKMVEEILDQRELLASELVKLSVVKKVYPSDANFLLVKTENGNKVYDYLISHQVITRNRSSVQLCEGCLRITVGREEENKKLLSALKKYS